MTASQRIRAARAARMPDFTLRREGTYYLVRPDSRNARNWIIDNIDMDAADFYGCWLMVDASDFGELFDGIVDSGFTVS